MEEIIEKKTIKNEGDKKPVMSVNEQIQVNRFRARFVIGLFALSTFLYIVHVMLGSSEELPTSSKDLLNILIGAFIPILAGIAKFYFESGGDLHQEPEKNPLPPHPTNSEKGTDDSSNTG